MRPDDSLKIEFERRWALVFGILSVLGVALIAGSYIYNGASIPAGDGGQADYLIGIEANRSVQLISSLLQALGYFLLIAPLVFLFKAASARAPQVRTGLIGVIIAAPLFMGTAAITNSISNLDASQEFASNSTALIQECVADKNAEAKAEAADGTSTDEPDTAEQIQADCEDSVAEDLRGETSTSGLTAGFGFAGVLGFTISVVYVALWAMRVGLVTRFWGSLGMALGAVSILFPLFVLLWFIYAGLLIAGWVPKGRPEAWAAGVAVPWPDPRNPAGADDLGDQDVIDGTAEEVDGDADDLPEGDDFPPDDGETPRIERRKRKKRNG